MPPRTIDNLGVDASSRYAEDQRFFDDKIIKESQGVSAQTQIEVTLPSFTSEWEGIFELRRRNQPWADFIAPPKYAEQTRRLFTSHILPALNSEEMVEAQVQRVKSRVKEHSKDEEEARKQRKLSERWEQEQEDQNEEKQKQALLLLLNCINLLDKVLMEANARRTQYQKG